MEPIESEYRQRFAICGIASPAEAKPEPAQRGSFEILAITAGLANGWTFPARVLEQSLPLWNDVECFLDHDYFNDEGPGPKGGRSVRDLAGLIHSPEWDAGHQGVKAALKAVGPGGQVLTELGREMLLPDVIHPNVGFSADILFNAKEQEVQQIIKVFSVDLVIDPASGGKFIRSLNQRLNTEVLTMPETITQPTQPNPASTQPTPTTGASSPKGTTQAEQDQAALRLFLGEQQRMQALQEQANQAREVRVQMCGYLLDSALSSSAAAPTGDRTHSFPISKHRLRTGCPAERPSKTTARWFQNSPLTQWCRDPDASRRCTTAGTSCKRLRTTCWERHAMKP